MKTLCDFFPQKSFFDFYIAYIRMMNDLISIYYIYNIPITFKVKLASLAVGYAFSPSKIKLEISGFL